jgi:MFS family permease
MSRRGPLADSYGAAAALVAFALIPYLALTSSMAPLQQLIGRSLGLSAQTFETTTSMANAGYAFGTLLAVQFAVRMRPRRMLLFYAMLLVLASVSTAMATTPAMFIAGHIIQGLCTSLLLIAAVPPLVIGWPAKRMPITAGVMNLCIFGAVALGPIAGGVQAAAGAWRPIFWIATAASVIALLLVLLTWDDKPGPEPRGSWDPTALLLAGGGCAAAFFGAAELTTHPMLSVIAFLPLVGGTAAVVVLIIHQSTTKDPLVPIRELASTKPVAGIIAAMAAGAASVSAIDLIELAIKPTGTPEHLAMLFWPFFGGAVLMAIGFGLLLKTRFLVVAVLTGLTALAGGIAITTGVVGGPHSLVVVGSGLIGIGVGSSVAPALFVAGYSVRSMYIQRVLALVELLRAVAAFMTVPVLVHLAETTNGGITGGGIKTGLWVCFAIAAGGGLISLYILVLGRARLQRPDIERWENDGEPAWESPPLADGIRHREHYPGAAAGSTR